MVEMWDHIASRRYRLLQRVTMIPDNPSSRALNLQPTRKSGKDYSVVLNDVYRVQSVDVPTSEAIANLKERLLVCGYKQWLEEG